MNLADRLTLTRPLAVLDLETTGLRYDVDRIVEIGLTILYPPNSCAVCLGARFETLDGPACVGCHGTGRQPPLAWETLVDPRVPIKENVHGITEGTIKACRICNGIKDDPIHTQDRPMTVEGERHDFKSWPTFAQLAGRLSRVLTNVDFAGKNVRFDLQFLAAEFVRANVAWSCADAAIVCADGIERIKDPRDLSSLYRKRTGKEPVDAHRALADVEMTIELLEAQFALWPDLPTTPAEVHALLWANWIDGEGKFRFDRQGVPTVWFGKHRGVPMAEVPVDYWDFVLKATFAGDVKELARRAKLGEFPKKERQ